MSHNVAHGVSGDCINIGLRGCVYVGVRGPSIYVGLRGIMSMWPEGDRLLCASGGHPYLGFLDLDSRTGFREQTSGMRVGLLACF